jgi:hypothetical protein
MKRKVASRKDPSCEKYRSSKGQGGTSPWKASCFWSKMKEFLRESSWSVEVVHFLLFSPVLLERRSSKGSYPILKRKNMLL